MFQQTGDIKKTIANNIAANKSAAFFSPFIQPKLTINQPDDEYEKEADAMAEHVMRMTDNENLQQPFFKPAISFIQRKCAHCEEEEKQQLQRKAADGIIQKQPTTSTSDTSATQTQIPHLTLESSSLFQPSTVPDFLSMRRPFFDRNIGHLWDPDSALHVWQYNFNFFRRFGLPPNLSTTLTNFTAPRFIDSQLKAGNPTWWEITDRELNTSTIGTSIPVLEFNANFSPVAPSWLRSIFGGSSVQRKENASEEPTATVQVENYISCLNGGGKSLDTSTKKFFESRFDYDFSDVKIHDDAEAAISAQSINALAYTAGNNIVFGTNQFQPANDAGKKLLAHELTHVIQQGNKNTSVQRQTPSWSTRVSNASSQTGAAKDTAYVALIRDALGTGVTVQSSTNSAASIDAAITAGNYTQWNATNLTVNFDANFNNKAGIGRDQYGDTVFKTDGATVRVFIILGPNVVKQFGPEYTQMANAHEQTHARDFTSQAPNPHAATAAEELSIYTQGFVTYFLSLIRVDSANCSVDFGEYFDPLFNKYAASNQAAKDSAFQNIQTFYTGTIQNNASNLLKFKIWLQSQMNDRSSVHALAQRMNSSFTLALTRGTNPITHISGCQP